jgi:hypothetical protein
MIRGLLVAAIGFAVLAAYLKLLGLWPIRARYVAARQDWPDPYRVPFGDA